MNSSNTLAPDAPTAPTQIQFHVEPGLDGTVESVTEVSWQFSDDVIETIAERRSDNLHLLVLVGTRQAEVSRYPDHEKAGKAYDDAAKKGIELSDEEYESLVEYREYVTFDYDMTQVQLIELFDSRGNLRPPKTFLQFNRPGENFIAGKVVPLNNPDDASTYKQWTKRPNDARIYEYVLAEEGESDIDLGRTHDGFGFSMTKVSVAEGNFAKPRSKAAKALVRQYFRGHEDDECHFRKRLIASGFATVPVQLYGLFVRVFALLIAFVGGNRGTFNKSLFALNPHDYIQSLKMYSSIWLSRKDGTDLPTWRMIVSPIGLAIALIGGGIIGLVCTLVGLLVTSVWATITNYDGTPDPWIVFLVGLGTTAAIVAFCFLWWVAFFENGHRWFRQTFVYPVRNRRHERRIQQASALEANPEAKQAILTAEEAEKEALVALMQGSQRVKLLPSMIANRGWRLWFLATKAKVCKPFAKPVGAR